jgi:predicted lactoylglutathione lyase
LREEQIYSMLVTHELFSTFTNRPIAEPITTQVLIAIEVDSKEKVDEMIQLALENGGSRYRDSADHGWMYYDSFADLDGHQWEVLYIDTSKMQ